VSPKLAMSLSPCDPQALDDTVLGLKEGGRLRLGAAAIVDQPWSPHAPSAVFAVAA
jgi:hypothetical protein